MTAASESDEEFMRRAIRLAMRGRGSVEPNPMVGCVIVKQGRVIGQGWHQQFGGPHAEPNALAAKKTPPCVPRLIEARLGRVVIGCIDPNPKVAGRGVAELKEAGLSVDTSNLEPQARQLIAPFLVRVVHRRPYVTLKWAESADGKVAGPGGVRRQISNARSTRIVHELRARSDVILTGIGTVLADDPLLTPRDVPIPMVLGDPEYYDPVPELERIQERVVLDSRLRLPHDSQLARTAAGKYPVRVFCSYRALTRTHPDDASALSGQEVVLEGMPTDENGQLSLDRVLRDMHPSAANVVVEAGPKLVDSFLRLNLADRIWVFKSSEVIGEASAPDAPKVPSNYIMTGETDLDGDTLAEYLNPASPVYFAAEPSADFLLAAGRLQ